MTYKCEICGKQAMSGNNVSHSNRHTRTKFIPNLQKIRVLLKGTAKKALVCTNCIKSGKAVKVVRRNYKPEPAKTS